MPHEAWAVKEISRIISTAQDRGMTARQVLKAIVSYQERRQRLAELMQRRRFEERQAKNGGKF
jgi:hypothetical protein